MKLVILHVWESLCVALRNPGMNQPMSWEEIWSEGSFRCCGFGREINVILGNRRPSWVFTGACFPCCFSKIYIDDTSVTLNRKNVKKKNITIPKKHSNHQMFRHLNFKFSFYTYIYIYTWSICLCIFTYLSLYMSAFSPKSPQKSRPRSQEREVKSQRPCDSNDDFGRDIRITTWYVPGRKLGSMVNKWVISPTYNYDWYIGVITTHWS